MTVRFDDVELDWLGYATAKVQVDGGPVVYTDPGRYGVLSGYDERDGDLVLVTHGHHYDPDGIRRVSGDGATVVVHAAVDAATIDRPVEPVDDLAFEVIRVDTGREYHLPDLGVDLRTTPAHNHVEDGTDFERVSHPPGTGCGFRVSLGGRSIFWPGDTDLLPALTDLRADVLLANIGGSVVMDRHAAADLAERLGPDLVVPIHYDTIELLEADAGAFAADVAGRAVPVALDDA